MIRQGSRSFFAASLLLPLEMRGPAYTLYAFCRLADDAVDNGGSTESALARLSDRLERAYAGRPLPAPADRAFADLVADYAIPRALPEALLEGLAWDAEGRRYDDLSALNAYAARVAGTVGVMMALLMGARAPGVLARACELGVAMQFTNIARDVGEDARMGRIYLPLAWLRDAGIDPDAWLARPCFDARLGGVVQRLLSVADALYDRAIPGIAALPWACRPGILAARMLYAEIGRELERSGLELGVAPVRRAGRQEAPAPRPCIRCGSLHHARAPRAVGAAARGSPLPCRRRGRPPGDAAHGRPGLVGHRGPRRMGDRPVRADGAPPAQRSRAGPFERRHRRVGRRRRVIRTLCVATILNGRNVYALSVVRHN